MFATARVISANPIRVGDLESPPILFLDATRPINIGGNIKQFTFKDEYNKPVDIAIEGQMKFDLDNAIQARNWGILTIIHATDTLVSERLVLHDPKRDGDAAMKRFELEQELNSYLSEHRNDLSALANLHRQVIGLATGIPVQSLFIALTEKAKQNVEEFRTKGVWVWEERTFEIQALLAAAMETGQVVMEGDSYRQKDGTVIGMDKAAAIHAISKDPVLRNYLAEKVELVAQQPLALPDRPAEIKLEDSNLIKLTDDLGEDTVDELPENLDGSDDMQGAKDFANTILEQRYNQLVAAGVIMDQDGAISVTDIHEPFSSKNSVIDHFRLNPAVLDGLMEQIS